jgi:hypothetical protein
MEVKRVTSTVMQLTLKLECIVKEKNTLGLDGVNTREFPITIKVTKERPVPLEYATCVKTMKVSTNKMKIWYRSISGTPLNIGHFPLNIGHFPLNIGHFPLNIGHFPLNIGHFPLNIGHFSAQYWALFRSISGTFLAINFNQFFYRCAPKEQSRKT